MKVVYRKPKLRYYLSIVGVLSVVSVIFISRHQHYTTSTSVVVEKFPPSQGGSRQSSLDNGRLPYANNKYNLWPNLRTKQDLTNGTEIFGINEAMDIIWRNQNPPDCSKAKYLISTGWFQGFGSEVHFHGAVLGMAIDTGPVFLQEGGWTWRYRNEHCISQNKMNMECYMLPYSKCTIEDAMKTMQRSTPHGTKYSKLHTNDPDNIFEFKFKQDNTTQSVFLNRITNFAYHSNSGRIQLVGKYSDQISDNVIVVDDQAIANTHGKYFPKCMNQITNKMQLQHVKLQKGYEYMWWRAISATYLLRPNAATLALIEKLRDPQLKAADGNCASVYVRHGDKVVKEMKYVKWEDYAAVIKDIFDKQLQMYPGQQSYEPTNPLHNLLFLATEDAYVLEVSQSFAKTNQINMKTTEFNHKILSDKQYTLLNDLEKKLPKNREWEYFSYLLHLSEQIRCNVNICTIPSNFCRLVDELRGTIGGKANVISVDMSDETCEKVPCYRTFRYANYVGNVYDPKNVLW